MKLVKKWLFPALTCLIVLGAAVFPPYISQIRDEGLFGTVHAQLLEAGALPTAKTPTLRDRIMLYASRYSTAHPILYFNDPTWFEDSEAQELALAVQERLTEAGVLTRWMFEDDPFDKVRAGRLLLWDPAENSIFQKPCVYWEISWDYSSNKSHQKNIKAIVDTESGLPVYLYVHDTNMSQWLAYDRAHLHALSERYFAMLALETRADDLQGPGFADGLNLSYSITDTQMYYFSSRTATNLEIMPDLNWRYRAETDGSSHYDG